MKNLIIAVCLVLGNFLSSCGNPYPQPSKERIIIIVKSKSKTQNYFVHKEDVEKLTDKTSKDREGYMLIFSIIVTSIGALLIIYLYIAIYKLKISLKSSTKTFEEKIDRESVIEYVLSSTRITNKIKNSTNKVEMFEDKLQSLDRKIGQLQIDINNKNKGVVLPESKNEELAKEEIAIQAESDRIFLKEREGMILFKESIKENAFYELLNINGTKAIYRFCGDIGRAMANYDTVMKDVFDDEKSYSSKAKQIINTKDGIVEQRSDGKWEIRTPAKIKFIS